MKMIKIKKKKHARLCHKKDLNFKTKKSVYKQLNLKIK